MEISELIYDWNQLYPRSLRPPGPVLLTDETLRDGLQSPSVRDPSIEQKIEILHLMEALGINSLDLGLPGAGPRAVEHVTALAREIVAHKMKIRPYCAARTHENDIRPIAEITQKTGLPIEVAAFLGSSPLRRFTEGWTIDFLLETTEKAVKFAVAQGLEVMYTTEDTTRCDPETVKRLNLTAIRNGARAIVLCDTAGHATPMGTVALVKFVVEEVIQPSGEKIRLDWHGHCDRGLATANAMAALVAGANCVHATALGIGERVGNTQMDQMLVNLKLMGIAPWDQQDLTRLKHYCELVSKATGVPDPGQLSGSRRRRLPHRHRRACRRRHQGLQEEQYRTRQHSLFGRSISRLRPRAGHRHRPHERKIKCPLLARAPRPGRERRSGRTHL